MFSPELKIQTGCCISTGDLSSFIYWATGVLGWLLGLGPRYDLDGFSKHTQVDLELQSRGQARVVLNIVSLKMHI